MYIYVSIHTYILEQGRWLDLKQGAKSLWNSAPKKCADLEQNLNLKEVRQQPSPMISYGDCQGRITRTFGCPLLTYLLALPRVALQMRGLWARPRFSEKSGKKGPWLMVPYGPRSDEKWSRIHIYKIVMVPWVVRNGPNICLNVDTDPPIYPPGWSITVDIDGRKGFTYMKIRSILTVDKDSPTENTVDRRWWIKIRVNLVVDFIDDTCEKLKCIDRNFTKSGTRTCLVQMIKWKQEFRNLISEGQDSDFWND